MQILPLEPASRLDAESKVATWTPDDMLSLAWVSVAIVVSALFALRFRRYTFAVLRDNPVATEWLQTVGWVRGIRFFFSSFFPFFSSTTAGQTACLSGRLFVISCW